MGSLKDEVYENLDYLSQLTEVIIAPENEILANFPDCINLSFEDILHNKSTGWGGVDLSVSISSILASHQMGKNIDYREIETLADCYEFKFSEDFEVDFEERKIIGTIML